MLRDKDAGDRFPCGSVRWQLTIEVSEVHGRRDWKRFMPRYGRSSQQSLTAFEFPGRSGMDKNGRYSCRDFVEHPPGQRLRGIVGLWNVTEYQETEETGPSGSECSDR